ncbi:MAG: hypothetical protein JWO09_968 [Bacteroidetes bacterium]|nr:hypothetical protein [Bacteroidota bacterium]
MENLNENVMMTPKRPQFLQVLCILSYIGCGIMILIGLFGLKNLFMSVDEILADSNMQMLQEMQPETYARTVAALQYKNINAITGILLPLLSLTGVLFMWKLRKTGFYLYVLGELLPYLLIAVTTGFSALANMGGMMESMQSVINVVLVLIVLFDLAFIVMYALNLKHMS